MSNQRYPKNSK